MDIKELNKTQLILLTLLITFVVSIATGIITVSIMQQMPKTVPQTINNIIQRTIERVVTTSAPTTPSLKTDTENKGILTSISDGDAVVSIYSIDDVKVITLPTIPTDVKISTELPKALGQGIIISDIGLILVDSDILIDKDIYRVVLNKIDFDATIIKKFSNGLSILKITQKKAIEVTPVVTPKVDIKP